MTKHLRGQVTDSDRHMTRRRLRELPLNVESDSGYLGSRSSHKQDTAMPTPTLTARISPLTFLNRPFSLHPP